VIGAGRRQPGDGLDGQSLGGAGFGKGVGHTAAPWLGSSRAKPGPMGGSLAESCSQARRAVSAVNPVALRHQWMVTPRSSGESSTGYLAGGPTKETVMTGPSRRPQTRPLDAGHRHAPFPGAEVLRRRPRAQTACPCRRSRRRLPPVGELALDSVSVPTFGRLAVDGSPGRHSHIAAWACLESSANSASR
jgi:hypothetical protein